MNSHDQRKLRCAWINIAMVLALLATPTAQSKDNATDKKPEKNTPEQVVHDVKKGLKQASKAIDRSVEQANKEVRRVLKGNKK